MTAVRIIGFVLLLGLLGPTVAAQPMLLPTPPVDPKTIVFDLKWSDAAGEGALVERGARAPSGFDADPGGPSTGPADTRPFAATLDRAGAASSGGRVAPPLTADWPSQPLPRTTFLDARRMAVLALYADLDQCNPSVPPTRIGFELRVGETLVAGALPGPRQYWSNAVGVPAEPPEVLGYCRYAFRFLLEADVLAAKSRLNLRIIEEADHPGVAPVRFAMAGRAQSFLLIPTMPFEDALWRRPEFEAGDRLSTLAGPTAGASPATAAGLGLGLALLPFAKRRGRAHATFAVLLALAASGCFEPSASPGRARETEAPLGGSGHVDYIQSPDEPISSQGLGTVVGWVHDEIGLGVSNAFVALIGTSNVTEVSSYGTFLFRDVLPATYLLRVDATGFRSFEAHVQVVGDTLTRLDIELEPTQARATADRAHTHDAWGTDRTIKLPPAQVPLAGVAPTRPCVGPPTQAYANLVQVACPTVPFRFPAWPDPARWPTPNPLIFPGTVDLEVKVQWTNGDGLQVGTIGLSAHRPGDALAYMYQGYPRGPGEPFHIPVTWETSDAGHQRFSTWGFRLVIPTHPYSLQRFEGTVTVEATLHRGPLPKEPPHLDQWGANVTKPAARWMTCTTGAFEFDDSCVFAENNQVGKPGKRSTVPEGTRWLNATFEVVRASSLFAAVEQAVEADPAFRVEYKTMRHPDWPATPTAFKERKRTGEVYDLSACMDGPGHDLDFDSPYQKSSGWMYRVDDGYAESGYDITGYTYWLDVYAHRTEPPPGVC